MTTQPAPASSEPMAPATRPRRFRISVPMVVIGIALIASLGYILYVVREVQDQQIQMLSYGFIALGLTLGAMAISCLVGMWRASSRAQGGRSFWLALVGGAAGLAAIGSLSAAALMLLVTQS